MKFGGHGTPMEGQRQRDTTKRRTAVAVTGRAAAARHDKDKDTAAGTEKRRAVAACVQWK